MSAVVQPGEAQIRAMLPMDVRAVMAIELAEYPFPWTARIFSDCLRVDYCCRIAEIDGQLVGYGIMSSGAGEAHILNVCVAGAFRRRSLGRTLMLHLLDEAEILSVETVFLEVRESNPVAIRLYEGLGFNQVGTRRDYYPAEGGREDAIIMALPLSFPVI
ncbi:MAG TPA: ribosomal-protein-alanine N-acetyltransferase [Chromatiales bacterium]|nr:ribosomal-protein-alanine N-acetyltransferase [Chromatiales bacterium]HEX22067.1 ribosomal-protein-alanine N-acetyltransferase [Chromatiales bacterium]